jgi:hypothetical protein
MKWLWNDWISPETWQLIAHRAMLCRTKRLCQTGGCCLHRQIGASLRADQVACMANVGVSIDTKLTGGNVQEAFRHLKGWCRATTETQSKPCYHTMDCQTLERVDLYARRQSPGDPLPILVTPVEINNDSPSDDKIQAASRELSNVCAGGALGMRAEHIKARQSMAMGCTGGRRPQGVEEGATRGQLAPIHPIGAGCLESRFQPLSAPLDHCSIDSKRRWGLLWDWTA